MKHLIVARYQEDISWLDDAPSDWKQLVVQKDVDIPNAGREASSYFWAMHKLYPTLTNDDLVACVQGNPYSHCPDLFRHLEEGATEFSAMGDWFVDECNALGMPHDFIPRLVHYYEDWTKQEWPGNLAFVAGAQFIVTGREIRRWPRSYLSHMRKEMSKEKAPWAMERLWESFFKSNHKES